MAAERIDTRADAADLGALIEFTRARERTRSSRARSTTSA